MPESLDTAEVFWIREDTEKAVGLLVNSRVLRIVPADVSSQAKMFEVTLLTTHEEAARISVAAKYGAVRLMVTPRARSANGR